MDYGPLVAEEIDAGAEFLRRFNDYAPVKAACWLRASGEGQRYLYVASDQIDDTNFIAANGEVVRLANEMLTPDLDLFRINVIYGNNPLAVAAAQTAESTARLYKGARGIRLGGQQFGGLWIEDGYVYPSPLPAPAVVPAASGQV